MKRVLLAIVIGLFSGGAMAESPNDVIEAAMTEIAAELHGRKDEFAADHDALYEMIDGIFLPRFDRRYAARLVLGKHGRTASDEQMDAFVDAFYASLVRNYAKGILQFEEDRIEVLAYRGDDTKSRTVVKTIVRLDDGTKVPVNYGVVKRESGWMMFDVVIEGISYVRNFRVELNSEIQSSSLDAVIARLQGEAERTEDS